MFAPDPGASDQSQIGGNVATNAGGPHTVKYGVTGAWVSGLEVVLAPGELVHIGGWAGKDVAGYDLKSLLVGSEGTLGVITAVQLRLLPAPDCALASVIFLPSRREGCDAIAAVMAAGVRPSVLDFIDGGDARADRGVLPRRGAGAGGLRADRRGRRDARGGTRAARVSSWPPSASGWSTLTRSRTPPRCGAGGTGSTAS